MHLFDLRLYACVSMCQVVKGRDGYQVLCSYAFGQHPVSASNPYLQGDQVPGPIQWLTLVHTLRTQEYVYSTFRSFFNMVAQAAPAAGTVCSRPCSPAYLPDFIFTDHDNALLNGFSSLFNLCKYVPDGD